MTLNGLFWCQFKNSDVTASSVIDLKDFSFVRANV
ncbi:hypothetical protein BDI4_1050024 [Burkholderia diffusa]|nr:hypothetical protein BDI4_1050024 [Burkholderia diffusa]